MSHKLLTCWRLLTVVVLATKQVDTEDRTLYLDGYLSQRLLRNWVLNYIYLLQHTKWYYEPTVVPLLQSLHRF